MGRLLDALLADSGITTIATSATLRLSGSTVASVASVATDAAPESGRSVAESQVSQPLRTDLERRIFRMADRWRYTADELTEVLELARADQNKWLRAVALDEQRETGFREVGILPRADA